MRKLAVLLIVVVALGVLAFKAGGYLSEFQARIAEGATNQPQAQLTDLSSIEQLKSAFDAAAGEPRLVLLFSPT